MSNEHQHDRLAAEHVMGMLDAEELLLAERLLASDPSFVIAVDRWRSRFSELDETAPSIPPEGHLWQRIENELGAAPAVVSHARRASLQKSAFAGLWESLSFWRATGIAAAFASLILAFGVGFFADKAARQPVLIAVLVNDANQPGAVVSSFADGRVELVPLGGVSIPPNRSMQVWTLPEPGAAPVSIGLLTAPRAVRLNLQNLPQPRSDQLFEISIEPIEGSSTGRPTGPVILKGLASTAL